MTTDPSHSIVRQLKLIKDSSNHSQKSFVLQQLDHGNETVVAAALSTATALGLPEARKAALEALKEKNFRQTIVMAALATLRQVGKREDILQLEAWWERLKNSDDQLFSPKSIFTIVETYNRATAKLKGANPTSPPKGDPDAMGYKKKRRALKKLVSENQMQAVFEQLLELAGEEWENHIILLQIQHKQIERKEIAGSTKNEDLKTEKSDLLERLLMLIDKVFP